MTEKVKFTYIARTICPTTKIHFLDAISEDGIHYSAEMDNKQEKWLVYSKVWTRDPQMPYDI